MLCWYPDRVVLIVNGSSPLRGIAVVSEVSACRCSTERLHKFGVRCVHASECQDCACADGRRVVSKTTFSGFDS